MEWEEVKKILERPFSPDEVSWRITHTNKANTKGAAYLYADLRAYERRLDEAAGSEWESYAHTLLEDGRIVCMVTLTIMGKSRVGVGEEDIIRGNSRNENAATTAYAQAFKRAASAWGLGRYLYSFPTPWVKIDNRRIPKDVQKNLDKRYVKWYEKKLAALAEGKTEDPEHEPVSTEEEPPSGEASADQKKPEKEPDWTKARKRWAEVAAEAEELGLPVPEIPKDYADLIAEGKELAKLVAAAKASAAKEPQKKEAPSSDDTKLATIRDRWAALCAEARRVGVEPPEVGDDYEEMLEAGKRLKQEVIDKIVSHQHIKVAKELGIPLDPPKRYQKWATFAQGVIENMPYYQRQETAQGRAYHVLGALRKARGDDQDTEYWGDGNRLSVDATIAWRQLLEYALDNS